MLYLYFKVIIIIVIVIIIQYIVISSRVSILFEISKQKLVTMSEAVISCGGG
jgi:flagellar biosynthesis protein FlhB